MIPAKLQDDAEAALGLRFRQSRRLGGGSINDAAVAETGSGAVVLKWNTAARISMFRTEETGLRLLNEAGSGLKIPEVLGTGEDGVHSWIAMEYIPEGRGGKQADQHFGAGLAQLHKNRASDFGLDHDNYIGRLPQSNSRESNWLSFFMSRRIQPQLRQAVSSGLLDGSWQQKLPQLQQSAASLFPDEPPSLLHGDLWSGNWLYTQNDTAAIFDPAVYYGNREIEIAFTSLFGRFPEGFYRSYEEAWPLAPGFSERRDLYNLYPVLVHVNLFGRSYTGQAESILRRYI